MKAVRGENRGENRHNEERKGWIILFGSKTVVSRCGPTQRQPVSKFLSEVRFTSATQPFSRKKRKTEAVGLPTVETRVG